jgi:acetolactate synthase-1/3 small subunit
MRILIVHVDDVPGVLNRVASLFRRRGANIDSLTVGRTERLGVSRMTVAFDADDRQARLMVANLYKIVPVRRVEDVTGVATVDRDLALVRIATTPAVRPEVLKIADVFRARVIDVSAESVVIEVTGTEDKIDGIVDVLRPYGVLEMARTGRITMSRGRQTAAGPAAPMAVTENDFAGSV